MCLNHLCRCKMRVHKPGRVDQGPHRGKHDCGRNEQGSRAPRHDIRGAHLWEHWNWDCICLHAKWSVHLCNLLIL